MTERSARLQARTTRPTRWELPALKVRVLGAAEVLVNGQPAEWSAASARDLFFYLLSHPQGRGREEILEELWGLCADAASGNRFRVTLHRLRAALGWPGAVVEEFGRFHLAPEVFRAADIHELYAGLQDAGLAASSETRLRGLQRALTAYKGDYLPGNLAEWARGTREEHRAAYVRACIELSMLYCERTECEGAVHSLARALRADPFIGENHHQKLMSCLAVVEGKYAATEHYRRFIRFLKEDLNDTPMPETVALAERIKRGEHFCRRLNIPVQGASGHEQPFSLNCPLTADGHCPGPLGELLNLK